MRRAASLAASALLAFATPVAAQAPATPLAELGAWTTRFLAATTEPNEVAAACGPQMNAAAAAMRDAPSARAALLAVRPCNERIRAAYARTAAALEQLEPLPATVEARAGFDSRQFLADHRRIAAATVTYLGDVERMLQAVSDGDRQALPAMMQKVRGGGATLADAGVLQLRAQRAISRLDYVRGVIDLRIVMARTLKAMALAIPTQAGFPVGPEMSALAKQAAAAVASARQGWRTDRSIVARFANVTPLADVLEAGDRLVADVTTRGDEVAALLAAAGRRPVLAHSDAVKLVNDLNTRELAIGRSSQAFASALQKIN